MRRAPPRVLPGQLLDQLLDLIGTAGRPVVFGQVHLFLIRRRCQVSRVPGVTIRCSRRRLGSSRVRAAVTARSVQTGFGRAIWRRKTATSSCSTRDLRVLRNVASREERQPAEQPDYEQIDEAKEHDCRGLKPRSGALRQFWRPQGFSDRRGDRSSLSRRRAESGRGGGDGQSCL